MDRFMKKLIIALAAVAALTSTAASAGNVFFSFGTPAPVYVQQRPVVYYQEYYGPGYVRYVPVYQPVYYAPPRHYYGHEHNHGYNGQAPHERWTERQEYNRREHMPRSW